ncbi:MAG: heavy metal translocating P-type ATPase [Erysipelotrichaceae bacterium]|nr:heavy metal translocating P-type ATPase [Erysipelotrichaceae bacterium]
MTNKQKKMLMRIVSAALLYALALLLPVPETVKLILFIAAYLIVAWNVLFKAVRNIGNGQVFDENFLMAVASLGAFALGEHSEAVAVMLFYQVGEWFQDYAVNRSRKSVSSLMDLRPDYANIETEDGLEQVDPEEVEEGTVIVVKPGERIPLDGVVLSGTSRIDTSALTGESVPRQVKEGEEVISGCINESGLLHVKVTKEFEESTVARILDLVENSAEKKSKSEAFITKFAKYYTPVVVLSALALAILPPLFTGIGQLAVWKQWIYRALTFLVISCPCALVLSVPLSFFGGIGGASKKGILIKGGNYLEALCQVKVLAMDKTGTLTKGTFEVQKTVPDEGFSAEEVLAYATAAENYSDHPIAVSLKEAAGEGKLEAKDVEETAGHGVKASVNGREVLVGNRKLLEKHGIICADAENDLGTVVYVAFDGRYAGHILIADTIKEEVKEAIAALKREGIRETVLLSGDNKRTAEAVCRELGIDACEAELLPADKVSALEKRMSGLKENEKLAFVGDGINDAPVLMRSDVGIAMGALGSDAAIEAADIVLMDDKVTKIAEAIRIARKTNRIVYENIWFAIGVKVLVLILSALGFTNMWWAVFADVGVAFLCVLNAMRCLNA